MTGKVRYADVGVRREFDKMLEEHGGETEEEDDDSLPDGMRIVQDVDMTTGEFIGDNEYAFQDD